jgi:uncharacterized membrane protein
MIKLRFNFIHLLKLNAFMDQKSIAWVSYLTLIGWIIALVSYNSSTDKSSLAKFHLRQSFGIMVTAFALSIVIWILVAIIVFVMPMMIFLTSVLWMVIWIVLLIFWVLGLVSAVNGEEKPVPVLGAFYQKTFTFL